MLVKDLNIGMALKLNGKKLAIELEDRLLSDIALGTEKASRPPGLAVIRVGNDPASGVYVSNKERACARVGVNSFLSHFSENANSSEVIARIQELNRDDLVDGILVQLPLPKELNEQEILAAIDPNKDADGLHTLNLGRLLKSERGPRSCTPAGVMALLSRYEIPIEGKRAVVVGRSILVGQPMALMLQAQNATVSIAHSRTKELTSLTGEADLLVVAAGRPGIIGSNHIKPGAVVVDVGIHRILSTGEKESGNKPKLCGDVLFEEVDPLASALTPVPGGVGPMTVTMLLVNTVSLWQEHCGLSYTLDDLLP